MDLYNFEKIHNKKYVDFVISIGLTCRPAINIQSNGLRFFSSPIDFMEVSSLDIVFHLFKTKFSDFFDDYKVDYTKKAPSGMVWVDDIKNKTYSIHHFKKDFPIEEEHLKFKKLMDNRAKKMDEYFKSGKNLVIMSERNETNEQFIQFLKLFSTIYPNLNIDMINVRNDLKMDFDQIEEKLIYNDNKLSYTEYHFNDTRYGLDVPEGNIVVWSKILLLYENENLLFLKNNWKNLNNKYKNIILYGADRKVARIENWLNNIGLKIECVVDNVDNIYIKDNGCIVLCIDDKIKNRNSNAEYIENILSKKGVKNIFISDDFLRLSESKNKKQQGRTSLFFSQFEQK